MISAESIAKEVEGMKGWADVTVHPSNMGIAIKAAQEHNATKPVCQVRVLFSVRLTREEFKVKDGNMVEKKRRKYVN